MGIDAIQCYSVLGCIWDLRIFLRFDEPRSKRFQTFQTSAAWDIPKRADRVVLADLWRALDFTDLHGANPDPFRQCIDIQVVTYKWSTNDLQMTYKSSPKIS